MGGLTHLWRLHPISFASSQFRQARRKRAVRVEHLLARGRVVHRPVEEEAGQRPEFLQRGDLVLGDGGGLAEPAAARERLQASRELLDLVAFTGLRDVLKD